MIGSAGHNFHRSDTVPADALETIPTTTRFTYATKGAKAHMVIANSRYVVLESSTAVAEPPPYGLSQTFVVNKREELKKAGILTEQDESLLRFTKNVEFETPSGAASVIAGGGVNGWLIWKRDSDGRALKEIEEAGGA